MKNKLMKMVKDVAANKKAVMGIKMALVVMVAGLVAIAYSTNAFATQADFDNVVAPVVGLIKMFVNPLLALVGAGGTIFCIMLGVKYATAEEPQEREKRKQALKTAVIGFLLIFILVVVMKLSIKPLTNWMNNSINGKTGNIQIQTP